MELHLNIVGILLLLLALMHVKIPDRFGWAAELKDVSLITKQILYVHTFFIAFVVFLMGVLCLISPHDLLSTTFGREISLGLSLFWFVRLLFQFFVYSSRLWRGKKFETIMHVLFSVLWIYFSAVFFLVWY